MRPLFSLLAALLASATLAAPLPPPRPAPGPWVRDWDKPTDPKGDCRFERDRGQLTITVPGEGHDLDPVDDVALDAPRLLRPVEGDFAVEVRVGGAFRLPVSPCPWREAKDS